MDHLVKGFTAFLLFLFAVGGGFAAYAAPSYTQFTKSTSLAVYSDGSAAVDQTLSLSQNVTSLSLPLFATQVGDVLVVTQDGSPLSYSISGGDITLYTLGATQVSLSYGTDALTSKQGAVWDLSFTTALNVSLTLPFESTVLSFSSTPTSMSVESGSPTLLLPPGSWQISYGLPVAGTTAGTTATSTSGTATARTTTLSRVTSTSSSTQQGAQNSSETAPASPFDIGVVAVIGSATALGALLRRARTAGTPSSALRIDDTEVLRFVKENGGRAVESEIRQRFSLPRTSAWRQAKRLEGLGLVKISKVGTQNQVELFEETSTGGSNRSL